jgi:N-methylhydantoinase B
VTVEIGTRDPAVYSVLAMFERVENPAQGRAGGGAVGPGRVRLRSGQALRGKGLQTITAGERIVLETPGGGGYGNPAQRSLDAAQNDVLLGLVSTKEPR